MNLLKGKLTYTLAAVAVVWGIVGLVFNWLETSTAVETIWVGLAAFGVRRALPSVAV